MNFLSILFASLTLLLPLFLLRSMRHSSKTSSKPNWLKIGVGVYLACSFFGILPSPVYLFGTSYLTMSLAGILWVASPVIIGSIFAPIISESSSHGFIKFCIDPMIYEDGDTFDPKRELREMDAVAYMMHHGNKKGALKLAKKLHKENNIADGAFAAISAHCEEPKEKYSRIIKLQSPKPRLNLGIQSVLVTD